MSKRVAPLRSDSIEDAEDTMLDARLLGMRGETGCDVVKRPRRRGGECNGNPLASSPLESETGEDNAGEDSVSSKSERNPSSREAAKLLEMSGSETKAKDECVEVVDVVEVVRPLAESRDDARGSSCQDECATSMEPYRRPLTTAGCLLTPATR